MQPAFVQHLTRIGLSDKEARVYVAMLDLGPAGVQEIATRSDVNRATTYLMLDALMARGLVSRYDDPKRTVFVAESPKRLSEVLQRERDALEEKHLALGSFIPELEAVFRTQQIKPVVIFRRG